MTKRTGSIHVLIMSNGFPNYFTPLDGIFYFDQAVAIKKHCPEMTVGYISLNPIGLRDFIKKPNLLKLGKNNFTKQQVHFMVRHYLNIPLIKNFDIKVAKRLAPALFKNYMLKYGKPDIIHVHGFEAGEAAIVIKEKYQVPFVLTEHSSRFLNGSLNATQTLIAQHVFQQSSQNIAVSNYFATELQQRFSQYFCVVANMVNITLSNNKNITEKKYDVIHVGTFNENKNQMLLLQTLAQYRFGNILLVGEGPHEKSLRDFVEKNELSGLVTWLPFQPRNTILELMKQSKCIAITSQHETFGVVAIEALSCGIPVISTKAGGPEDIVVNDETGYLIESTPASFYAAHLKISENLSKFRPEKLIAYAHEHFSEKAIVHKLLNIYYSVLSKNR